MGLRKAKTIKGLEDCCPELTLRTTVFGSKYWYCEKYRKRLVKANEDPDYNYYAEYRERLRRGDVSPNLPHNLLDTKNVHDKCAFYGCTDECPLDIKIFIEGIQLGNELAFDQGLQRSLLIIAGIIVLPVVLLLWLMGAFWLSVIYVLFAVCVCIGAKMTKITVYENGIAGVCTSKTAAQFGTILFDLHNFQLPYEEISSVEVSGWMYMGSITICVSGAQYLVFGLQTTEIQRIIAEQQRAGSGT